MAMEHIKSVFNKRKAGVMGNFRESSVMILLEEINGVTYIIFEVRALNLRHQPGDVCLPGGKIEEDESPKEAAIRETMEELNLVRKDIEYIGEMDYLVTPYGSIMYTFIGELKGNKDIIPSSYEVDHIFKVPLDFFLKEEPTFYEMEIGPKSTEGFPFELINRGENYKFSKGMLSQYFYKYENHVIWGFTARIVKEFIDIIKKERRK
ncbi:NUDIX hydrolase [Clostridium algidicarnis]|uniref:CoA pyrophosphatase n=1 Tax=Clostridium algidicarnis TaxID=37659 RepID=A0ABS6C064_9CLOT|nr:CoA pyrophosphatase [Clostridium algidicarnis]MBU3218869.1 CoA pyrophosphatase [Clostridium algidicarnis]